MFWHIDADIISLAIVIIIYICNRKLPTSTISEAEGVLRNQRFTRCIEAAIWISLIDIAASVIMEIPTSAFVYHLLMTIYFISIELVIVEWFIYILTILFHKDEKGRKIITQLVLLLYSIYVVFCLVNPWTGLIYSLGPNNEYSRGSFFSIMIVLYAIYTLAIFILILVRWKRIPKEFPGHILLLTPIIIALAIAAQLLISGWLLIVPSYMVCLLLAFLFLQTMRVRNDQRMLKQLEIVAETDNLTGLYNRNGMEIMVRQTLTHAYGQLVVVLLADIDNLKHINDTMGHTEGDRCIQVVANQLKQHFSSSDTLVRYGGDEFLVFFTCPCDRNTVHSSLQELIEEFRKIQIGPNNDTSICVSVGAAFGLVGEDSFEKLCALADKALYYVKRNGKNGYKVYENDMSNSPNSY